MLPADLMRLRLELSVKAKNGLDFIGAAVLVWAAIAIVWARPGSFTQKSLFTFWLGALTLPLAWLLSKVLRTTWVLPHNPLQPLGLWLNFAQLFYFPLLIFMFSYYPSHFIMAYGIITGAHFFPYAWFYRAPPYAVLAGAIPLGCLLLRQPVEGAGPAYRIPLFVMGALLVLAGLLVLSYRRNRHAYAQVTAPTT